MKKDTLNTAIRLGQLMTLLTPLANSSKEFAKGLSRLRSGVQEQVIIAVLTSDAAQGRRAESRIAEVHDALLASVIRYIEVPELMKRSRTERSVYPTLVVKKGDNALCRRGIESFLFEGATAIKLESAGTFVPKQEERAKVMHAYASALRNSSWLPLLMRLELGLAVANSENANLRKLHSSHPGREKLDETLGVLCPGHAEEKPAKRTRAKKVVVGAEGLYTVQVAFTVEALLANTAIAELAAEAPLGDPVGHPLTALLEAATKPVSVGLDTTPMAVAQGVMDTLVAGLVARNKAVSAEKEKAKAKADEAAKADALGALQKLSPKLLKILKANPELLNAA